MINDGFRNQFLINLNSYVLKGTGISSYHQMYFRGAVTNVWTTCSWNGRSSWFYSKSVWKYLVAKINYKSTYWFLNATNFHLKVFLNRLDLSWFCVIQPKRSFRDKVASVYVLGSKLKHILRLWKYQFINITKDG